MALKKEKKVEVVSMMTDAVSSPSVVFVKVNKLNANETNNFRRDLRNEGVSLKVAKKTLLGRALTAKNVSGTKPELIGEIAVAYGTDLLAPAREVQKFAKTHKEQVVIMGGVFEGVYKSQAEMLAIATIPSRETLIAQFVNIINSPIARFAIVMNEIAKSKEA